MGNVPRSGPPAKIPVDSVGEYYARPTLFEPSERLLAPSLNWRAGKADVAQFYYALNLIKMIVNTTQ